MLDDRKEQIARPAHREGGLVTEGAEQHWHCSRLSLCHSSGEGGTLEVPQSPYPSAACHTHALLPGRVSSSLRHGVPLNCLEQQWHLGVLVGALHYGERGHASAQRRRLWIAIEIACGTQQLNGDEEAAR